MVFEKCLQSEGVSSVRQTAADTRSCSQSEGGGRVLSSFIYVSIKHSQLTSVVLVDREGSGALVYRQSVLQGLIGR